jgi:hypothetical protein
MADDSRERTEDGLILSVEISDAELEAAALADNGGVYTQFGLCTVSLCPGGERATGHNKRRLPR